MQPSSIEAVLYRIDPQAICVPIRALFLVQKLPNGQMWRLQQLQYKLRLHGRIPLNKVRILNINVSNEPKKNRWFFKLYFPPTHSASGLYYLQTRPNRPFSIVTD